MFSKRDRTGNKDLDTLIGPGTILEGNIETNGVLRVEGKINGDLKVNGDIYIGSNAEVIGNITANDIHISGSVKGNINSKGILRLLPTAKLIGDIDVNAFVVDEGSLFQGRCVMASAEADAENNRKNKSSKKHADKTEGES